MRIAIGEFSHEANTFIRNEVQLEYMKQLAWHHGQELLEHNTGYRDYLGGMIDAASAHDVEVLPTFSAHAGASGTLARDAYELARTELLTALEAALPVDAVCLALHGAAIANGCDDPEGDILSRVRALVGPDVPVVVTLDLHGNITQEMVDYSDLLLGVNFYPHVDKYDRGVEAIIRAVQIVRGEIRPTAYLALPPMLIPSTTSEDPSIHAINEACWAWEAKPGVLDCTFFHGFGWTDLPRAGVSVYAATNNDPALAKAAADDVAAFIWSRRDTFLVEPVSPAEAIERALAVEGQPVVINDGSDDPGGGAPGDGTYLLQAMLDAKLTNACFGFIVDPEVADQAHAAGAGSTIQIRLGGKVDDWHGESIETAAYVKTVTDGRFIHSSPMSAGSPADYGRCARLQIEGIDVIVASFRTQTIDQEIFLLHGIDISRYKIVGLKSSDHFRAGFRPLAAAIFGCHTRGLVSADFTTFPYKRLQRPIWPLDREMNYP
jgi:microcystin degradation protein MlrC